MGRDSRSRGRDKSRRDKSSDRTGPPQDDRGETCSIIVRNLARETSTTELKKAFEEFGDIQDCYVPLDYHTREPKGFAFIQFGRGSQAEQAIKEMNGEKLDGNDLDVMIAKYGRRDKGAKGKGRSGGDDRGRGRSRRDSRRGGGRARDSRRRR